MFAVRLFLAIPTMARTITSLTKSEKECMPSAISALLDANTPRHNLGSAQSGVTPEAHPRDMPGLFHAFLRCQFLCHTIFKNHKLQI